MTSGKKPVSSGDADAAKGSKSALEQPQWADGLKQLYDSVVDEPLPDSFKDLLSKLDDDGREESGHN